MPTVTKRIVISKLKQLKLRYGKDHHGAHKVVIRGDYKGKEGVIVNAWHALTEKDGREIDEIYFDLKLKDGTILVGLVWEDLLSPEGWGRFKQHAVTNAKLKLKEVQECTNKSKTSATSTHSLGDSPLGR